MTCMDDMELIMIVHSGRNEGTRISMRYDSTCTLDDLNNFLQQKFPKKLVRLHAPEGKTVSFCSHSIFLVRRNLITDVFPFMQQVAIAISEHGPFMNVRLKGMGSEMLFCLHTSLQEEGLKINEENIKVAIEGH